MSKHIGNLNKKILNYFQIFGFLVVSATASKSLCTKLIEIDMFAETPKQNRPVSKSILKTKMIEPAEIESLHKKQPLIVKKSKNIRIPFG